MSNVNSIVAVYEERADAAAGLRKLQKAGFDMNNLSVVGKEYFNEEHGVGYYHNSGERMKYCGKMGEFWGSFWDLLAGAAFFMVPGIGPILIAGPLTAGVVASLEGAPIVNGFTVLGAGLYGLGIARNSIPRYESIVQADKVLLVATDTAEELMKAKDILRSSHPVEVDVHFAEEPIAAGWPAPSSKTLRVWTIQYYPAGLRQGQTKSCRSAENNTLLSC